MYSRSKKKVSVLPKYRWGVKTTLTAKPSLWTTHSIYPEYYSLSMLSCRDNFTVCVNEPAHQCCEALRHHFISWSCDCHTFVNPLRKRNIGTRVSVIVIVERDAFFSLETTTFTKHCTLLNCYNLQLQQKKSVHPSYHTNSECSQKKWLKIHLHIEKWLIICLRVAHSRELSHDYRGLESVDLLWQALIEHGPL